MFCAQKLLSNAQVGRTKRVKMWKNLQKQTAFEQKSQEMTFFSTFLLNG